MREDMWMSYVADDQDSEPSGKVSHSSRRLSRLTVGPTWITHPLWVVGRRSWKIPRRLKHSKIDRARIRRMLLSSRRKCTHPCITPSKLHSKDDIELVEWFQPFFRVESYASARQERLQKGGTGLVCQRNGGPSCLVFHRAVSCSST